MEKEPTLGFQTRNYLSFSDHALLEQTVQELFIGASGSGIKGQQNHMEKLVLAVEPPPAAEFTGWSQAVGLSWQSLLQQSPCRIGLL